MDTSITEFCVISEGFNVRNLRIHHITFPFSLDPTAHNCAGLRAAASEQVPNSIVAVAPVGAWSPEVAVFEHYELNTAKNEIAFIS